MKLVTSTGDYGWYVPSIADEIAAFAGGKFKYINLEQSASNEELFTDTDDWKRLAENWAAAAEKAGVRFAVSHAPCLHKPIFDDEETYRRNIRALCRSIEISAMLGIERTVVHACSMEGISQSDFFQYNIRFYNDLLPTAEKTGVTLMTENWDVDYSHISTAKQMRELIDHIGHPLFAACWDTAHGNISPMAKELGQYENIVTLGDKLKGLHIADNFGDSHHHTWPFAGTINFDSVLQGLIDVNYDGCFTFEASYSLRHSRNMPYKRLPFVHNGETVTKLLDPSLALKQKAVDLLYETGRYLLETYGLYEE